MDSLLYRLQQRHLREKEDDTHLWGYGLLLLTGLFFVFFMYAIAFSKLVPATGFAVFDFFRYDYYYCALVPLLLPVAFVTVYLNWVGMKFFRHT